VPSACIDVGSNTTRLLVAEVDGALRPLLNRRAFTRIGSASQGGVIPAWKVHETAAAVAGYAALAREHGCGQIVVVATAAVREARNQAELVGEVEAAAGVAVRVLSAVEEARLAFAGATSTLSGDRDERVAVVDVGGGSTEVVLGTVSGGATWSTSLAVGSGSLADSLLRSDPPTEAELRALGARVSEALAGLAPISARRAFAAGGSATSLGRLVGPELGAAQLEQARRVLAAQPVDALAERFRLDPERVRLLRAGVPLLAALSKRIGLPLEIGAGGLREGVILAMEE